MLLRLVVLACIVALVAASIVACGGGGCSAFCPLMPTRVLTVENVTVVDATSSCGNAGFAPSFVDGKPLPSAATCHFDVTLSNGDTHAFDVPFIDHQKLCCCNSCQEGFVSDWNTVTISLPPSFDASPFPPFDASDADFADAIGD